MKIKSGKHEFELVDSVPRGYIIWNIGKNMVDGYLPLCRLRMIQPFEGGRSIETDTLKAIKCDGAQKILAAIGGGQNTVEKMERYIKRYSSSKNSAILARVDRMKKAVEVLKTIKFD